MTNRTFTQIDGEAGIALQGIPASPLPAASGSNVIQFSPRSAAASSWDEDEDADCFEPIGVLACRLVGQWSLPRILVWGAPGDLREEVSDPREL